MGGKGLERRGLGEGEKGIREGEMVMEMVGGGGLFGGGSEGWVDKLGR